MYKVEDAELLTELSKVSLSSILFTEVYQHFLSLMKVCERLLHKQLTILLGDIPHTRISSLVPDVALFSVLWSSSCSNLVMEYMYRLFSRECSDASPLFL
jgi:hypothetical protein